jgi:REP element-mobilizing transposase RayT
MEPDTFYHIYNHAIGSENLFRNKDNYLYFLKRYAKFIPPIADTYSYCLIPNHFHLLIKTKSIPKSNNGTLLNQNTTTASELNPYSKAFADLFNSYTKSYNKRFKRRGSLFIHKFKRKKVDSDSYFSKLILYIHSNPVHHGFVKTLEEWHYSSYNSLISSKSTALMRDEVLNWFNGQKDFIEFHQTPMDDDAAFTLDS